MNFSTALKNTYNNRKQLTENGAVGYATSGHDLLDMNFAIGSMRNKTENEIKDMFAKAYYENPKYAVKFLFYLGDVRGGVGERRSFNACVSWMEENKPELLKALLSLIPEYTRWDNLIKLVNTSLKDNVVSIVNEQLKNDIVAVKNNANCSLLGKWMPSECSKNKAMARTLMNELGLTPQKYRKMLTKLRAYLDVVEVKMSDKRWSEINYPSVPSKANIIYKDAFLKNDKERREEYLNSLASGKTKINASVAFPYDIVSKYRSSGWYRTLKSNDETLEAMWKALPDYVNGASNILVVGDGSGSMYSKISPSSNVMAVDVADSLAIYFAERASGQFANQYITFGSDPHLVDFSNCKTLKEKITLADRNTDCGSTDIEKIFRLILKTAIDNNMKQDEIPSTVLILSDCEFNAQCYYGENVKRYRYGYNRYDDEPTLFDSIGTEYKSHGYTLPKLVFWNINSRTGTVPVKQNEAGVILVSGFSPAVCKMVLSNKLDPYKALIEILDSERYLPVENVLQNINI